MKSLKRILSLLLGVGFISLTMSSCQKENGVDNHIKAYQQAIEYSDYSSAAQSLLYVVSSGPEYANWKDTLMGCYTLSGQLLQAATIGEELLKENASDTGALKIVALAYKQAQNHSKTLEAYEKLYEFYPEEHYFAYEILSAQYNLGRMKEAIAGANFLLQKEGVSDKAVNLIFNNQKQQIRMDAALVNLQGVILKDMNDLENAKKAFSKALEIEPKFLLAKGNLDALQ